MDEMVKAALKKWPNVPHCYDWLALDARGDWYMRDERIQQAGTFPQVKGSRIDHDKLKEFIHRNYDADPQGAWFFQNGPQRVYVVLEAAPWVIGVQQTADGAFDLHMHTGLPVTQVELALTDEDGRLFLQTSQGFGVVRSPDMLAAAAALEQSGWALQTCRFAELPDRFGYVLRPLPMKKPT